jgi:hypothetical protein
MAAIQTVIVSYRCTVTHAFEATLRSSVWLTPMCVTWASTGRHVLTAPVHIQSAP